MSLGDQLVNIQSAKAIIVNTTLKEKLDAEYKKKNRFIGRFPIEPFVNEFEPDERRINSCGGYPKYKAFVRNQYNGFGLHPNWKKSAPITDENITEYFAEVSRTGDPKVIAIDFPSRAQLYPGEYKLIIFATVYDPGYKNSERTISANINHAFELVEDSDDAIDNPVQLEIYNSDDTVVHDAFVISGSYSNDSIIINRNDGTNVNIDVSPMYSWYEGD